MSVSARQSVPVDPPVPADAIPMTAPVYVRTRHRLREVEDLLQQRTAEPAADDGERELRTERAVLESRAATLRGILERVVVVPISARAIVGSIVYVRAPGKEGLERYEIVVSTEADPQAGKVSFDSPIGAALIGREVGEVAVVATPRGQRELRVMVVKHE